MAHERLVFRRAGGDRALPQPLPGQHRHAEVRAGLDLERRVQLDVERVVGAELHPVAVRPEHQRLRAAAEQPSAEPDVALPHRQVDRLGSSCARHDHPTRSRQRPTRTKVSVQLKCGCNQTWNWVIGSPGQWVISVMFHARVTGSSFLTRCETRVFPVFAKGPV